MTRIAILASVLLTLSAAAVSAQTKLTLPASGEKMTLAITQVSGVHFSEQITHTTGQQQNLCEKLDVLDQAGTVVSSLTRGETRVVVTQNALAIRCNEARRGTADVVFLPSFK